MPRKNKKLDHLEVSSSQKRSQKISSISPDRRTKKKLKISTETFSQNSQPKPLAKISDERLVEDRIALPQRSRTITLRELRKARRHENAEILQKKQKEKSKKVSQLTTTDFKESIEQKRLEFERKMEFKLAVQEIDKKYYCNKTPSQI